MGFKDMIPQLTMEFIGTLLLGFTIATGGGAVGVGVCYAVIVYAGGPISGGCYNPAVALAATLNGALGEGKKDWVKFGFYCLFEFLGAFVGFFLGYLSRRDDGSMVCIDQNDTLYNLIQSLLNEFLWVTFLCYVVLATACTDEKKDNQYFGWCIGFALSVGLMGAQINGGGLNPAISLGGVLQASIVKPKDNDCADDSWGDIWWRIIIPFVGSAAAWGMHMLTNPKQYGLGKLEKFAAPLQEMFGTLFFALAISLSGLSGGTGSLLNGTCYAIVVYCGAHISGGQYNPAVSLGMWIRGKQPLKQMFIFWGMQFLGAFLGALLGYLLTRYDDDNATDPLPVHPALFDDVNGVGGTDVMAGFCAELVVTFMLVLVVLLTTTYDKVENNHYFGLAIGYVVVAGTYGVGSTSTGAAFNPAIWLGTNLMYMFHENGDDFVDFWLYISSELLGGLLAGLIYRVITGDKSGVAMKLPTKVAPGGN